MAELGIVGGNDQKQDDAPVQAFEAMDLSTDTVQPPKKCPGGHSTQEFRTPTDKYNCDVCKQRGFPKNSRMYGCRKCDWDMCAKCYNGGLPKAASTAVEAIAAMLADAKKESSSETFMQSVGHTSTSWSPNRPGGP